MSVPHSSWRSPVAGLLTVLAVLLLPLAIVASWTENTLGDTEVWVQQSQDLLDEPEVRDSIAQLLSAEVVDTIGANSSLDGALGGLLDHDAIPPGLRERIEGSAAGAEEKLATGIRAIVDTVVLTPAFRIAWEEGNRELHKQLLHQLEDPSATSQPLVIDLGPAVAVVFEELTDSGLPRSAVPRDGVGEFTVASADVLGTARSGWDALGTVASILFPLVAALAVLALAVAPARLRLLGWGAAAGALVVALTVGVVHLAVGFGSEQLAGGRVGDVVAASASAMSDPLVQRLWWWAGVLGVLAVVALIVNAVVTRRSPAAFR